MQPSHGICIHAHFYQPPREDPWLDAIMHDPTAAPYHDWNVCIHDQCYRPNRAARLTDDEGRIVYIANNYRNISFNVGPTLHSWLDRYDPVLSRRIAAADGKAQEALGSGGAIAQAYNHIIMPLAADRDIRTQILWGVEDFRHRFGRKPRGMWLPETAVDNRTLEALVAAGIEFVILAPGQCAAVRSPSGDWRPTPGGEGLDVTRPYTATLPSGSTIKVVFYYGSIAHDIAFGGLLNNGDAFAEAMIRSLPRDDEPRLLLVATDGETFGHHHRHGEMALARATQVLSDSHEAMLTNIPSFLDHYPPTWACRVAENTSWSCAHGVERWRSDCGCHTGGGPGWHQRWRGPLRTALDHVRDTMDEIYEREVSKYCDSPWLLRDEAIALYLTRPDEVVETAQRKRGFIEERCGSLDDADLSRVLSFAEMQRMRMFMYTSCGWFFNDVAGIETRQILAYALRAIEYTASLSGVDLTQSFMNDLEGAAGNTKESPTGRDVAKSVLEQRRDIADVAASAALVAGEGRFYSFHVASSSYSYPSGDMSLRISDMTLTDTRTLERWRGGAAVLSTGGLDDVCRLTRRGLPGEKDVWGEFYQGDIMSISRYIEGNFEMGPWHLKDLPFDDKNAVAAERTKLAERGHLDHAEELLSDNQRLLVQTTIMGVPHSPFLQVATELVFRHRIDELCNETGDILELLRPWSALERLLDEARSMGVYPSVSALAPRMESAFRDALADPLGAGSHTVEELLELWARAAGLNIEIDKWRLQNRMWAILEGQNANLSGTILKMAAVLGFATPAKLQLNGVK